MGYSTRATKTATGKFFADVRTGAYGSGYSVHRTEEFDTAAQAYTAAKEWQKAKAEENKAAKASKDGARMTCQCCGNGWLANNGKIAHHGYQRPGDGWQTASCNGARELPFEVSRDALGRHIDSVRQYLANTKKHLKEVEAETISLAVTFTDYEAKYDRFGRNGRPTKTVLVTRATFDAMRAENLDASHMSFPTEFDAVKRNKIGKLNADITNTQQYIKYQSARFNGWKQTHKWDKASKEWKKI